ncbi:single-stranded-DNA-specific exonuclease RecJ [Candidatus Wolfebacteria bacterium]|nr:MAG: single-stranded-DNA-specific exonuclease RecJ [Candidatus Wolfebacteria bacterium]
MKNYVVREPIPESAEKELAEYSDFVRHLLYYRGVETKIDAEEYLNPNYDLHVHDPSELKDIDKAVDRIVDAMDKNERIAIYSDYDTDGIPGAVILHDFFKKIKYENFTNYIPHRNKEGFGLNVGAIDALAEDKVKLIITIDCGITDVPEVKRANEKGMDVIITDHHLTHEVVPEAYAIVNPKQESCKYSEDMLCGSGVIFKLVQALLNKHREKWGVTAGWEKWLLDMVGIATLSDMVPLQGENRVLAYYGLKVLRKSPRPGLQQLLRKLKVNQRFLTEEDIGFTIGPRINAASRMGVPIDAFHLLATTDEVEAGRLAVHLNEINDERKSLVAVMVREIHKTVKERYPEEEKKIIVLGNPKWKPSLVGLVANKLMEEYNCPVFLWGREEGNEMKGSCRSNGSVDVVKLMKALPDGVLAGSGGHAMAGGFSVTDSGVHVLAEEMEKAFEKVKMGEGDRDTTFVDRILSIDEVNWRLHDDIDKLSPFGVGNARPLFMLKGVIPSSVRTFGKQKNHLGLTFKNSNDRDVDSIGFFMTPETFGEKVKEGQPLDLVVAVEKSMFRGRPELRMRIIDVI